jgi:hypothetical protein
MKPPFKKLNIKPLFYPDISDDETQGDPGDLPAGPEGHSERDEQDEDEEEDELEGDEEDEQEEDLTEDEQQSDWDQQDRYDKGPVFAFSSVQRPFTIYPSPLPPTISGNAGNRMLIVVC